MAYDLVIKWPDEPSESTESYQDKDTLLKRIEYIKQLPYAERPAWEIIVVQATGEVIQ